MSSYRVLRGICIVLSVGLVYVCVLLCMCVAMYVCCVVCVVRCMCDALYPWCVAAVANGN